MEKKINSSASMAYVWMHTPSKLIHSLSFSQDSSTTRRSVWARAQFTCLSLASVNTREHIRIHTAISNGESMKHSMCVLPGGSWDEATHWPRAAALCHNRWPPSRAEPLIMHVWNKHSAHHQEPSFHSDVSYFQSSTLLLAARKERERQRRRERLPHCSHHRDDRGPLKVEQHQWSNPK